MSMVGQSCHVQPIHCRIHASGARRLSSTDGGGPSVRMNGPKASEALKGAFAMVELRVGRDQCPMRATKVGIERICAPRPVQRVFILPLHHGSSRKAAEQKCLLDPRRAEAERPSVRCVSASPMLPQCIAQFANICSALTLDGFMPTAACVKARPLSLSSARYNVIPNTATSSAPTLCWPSPLLANAALSDASFGPSGGIPMAIR